MKKILVIALALLLLPSLCFGAVGVRRGVSHLVGTATDIDVGSAGYFDGSVLYLGYTSIYGVSTMVSGSTAIPVAYSTVHKQIGQYGNSVGTLADGTVGEVMYIDVASNAAGYNWVITPTTKTGFTTITMSNVGSYVVLLFQDTTVGWVVVGMGGNVVLA